MKTNIQAWDRVSRAVLGAVLAYAAYAFFVNPVARIVAALGALLMLAEGALGVCLLQRRLGIRSLAEGLRKDPVLGLLFVQLVLAYEWLTAGWEKLTDAKYALDVNQALAYFASKNPFAWYKDFLTGYASANSSVFAALTQWGETAAGAALFLSAAVYVYAKSSSLKRGMLCLALAALLGGLFMNANFYLAAAWTSPGARGVNVVMFWIQAALASLYVSVLADRKKV